MAKPRSIGSIYAELTLRDKMSKGLASAQKSLTNLGKQTAKYASIGIGLASGAMLAGTKRALDQADAINDLSTQTGASISDLMVLQRAYKDGGREAEMAGKDIAKMQKAIATAADGGADPFATIGLSVKDLMQLDAVGQMNAIGDAIMRIENPAQRTAKLLEIFGKSGSGLTTIFGTLDASQKALGKMPALAEKFGAAMGEANDLVGHLPIKSDQFFMGFTAGIIGELLPSLQKIDDFDFTTLGENLGSAIGVGFEGLKDGTIWEIFALNAQAKFLDLGNYLTSSLLAAIDAVTDSQSWLNWLKSVDAAIGSMLSEDPQRALELAQKSTALAAGGTPDQTFKESFQKYFEAGKDTADQFRKDADKLSQALGSKYQDAQTKAAAVPRAAIENPIYQDAQTKAAAVPRAAIENPIVPAHPLDAGPQHSVDFINDYQKRGLSLGGAAPATTESKLDQQTGVLREMRDLLRRVLDTNPVGTW